MSSDRAQEQRERELLRRQKRLIDKYGWTVMGIFPTENSPGTPFSYTVGLTAKGLPELVIAGLDPRSAQPMLNHLATLAVAKEGGFEVGERVSGVIEKYDFVIVSDSIGDSVESLFPGWAIAMYGPRVTLQQAVWPDKAGFYPWDLYYSISPEAQPVLGRP